MEIKEAIEYLKESYDCSVALSKAMREEKEPFAVALEMAIAALKKQIPKKPNRIDVSGKKDGNWEERCPVCEKLFVKRITTEEYSKPYIFYRAPYCTCGQKIDWPE